ncbi:MAG: hypothetical protein HOM11_04885 [Methylococcales bacterium]|jgi:hypothetical protein|nr:hypothetical protein [Methylococcales bacterium]MBT7444948.1 hypothetical protein [Methylococcales bacterium]
MCGGVFFTHDHEEYRYYFPNPAARLPVILKSGDIQLMPWGRRKKQPGQLPQGGWARLDSIYAGRWDRYSPIPVKLPINQFMEKDYEGTSHWFDITKGKWIQGLIARNEYEQRVYVVTIESEQEDAVHNRWPRVLAG